jgi:putative tricarboxylic transport membrane protein
VLGGLLAVFLLIQLKRGRTEVVGQILTFERAGARSIVLILVGLVAATALLEPLGFRLSMLLLNTYLLVVLGVRNWIVIAIFAIAGSYGIYHVFYDLLKVPLPEGTFGL